MGKCCVLGKFKLQTSKIVINPANQRVLGLVEMTCGLVHASYSLPEWQAVKLTYFAPRVSNSNLHSCMHNEL